MITADQNGRRTFTTSFDDIGDFFGSYVVPQDHLGTCSHGQSQEQVRGGSGYSHKGWVYGANPGGENHRGYPTLQFRMLPAGGFRTPVICDFWVWLDFTLAQGEWVSLATFARRQQDDFWDGVLLNVDWRGMPHFMHVPRVGEAVWFQQDPSARLRKRQWEHVTVALDFSPDAGYAKGCVNGNQIAQVAVAGGHGVLEQAHFGLYCAPTVSAGVVFNDDLTIREMVGEV